MFDCITVGGASRDVFFVTEKGKIVNNPAKKNKKLIAFEYGSKIIPETTEFTYGGGGANTAIAFRRLGLDVATVLSVGTEGTGSLLVRDLQTEGVNCDYIQRNTLHHSALSLVVAIPGKDHTMFLYRGANNHLKIDDWRKFKTKWFYLSSLTGESAEMIPELFAYAKAYNVCVAWNPGSQQLDGGYHDMAEYLKMTDILFLNHNEAGKLVLSKSNRIQVSDMKVLLTSLRAMTGGIVVVTSGEGGSDVYDGKKFYHQKTFPVTAIDTTGCGDSYAATFLAIRFLGSDIETAMKLAAYNSANVVQYIGAQRGLMKFDELRAKIDEEDNQFAK